MTIKVEVHYFAHMICDGKECVENETNEFEFYDDASNEEINEELQADFDTWLNENISSGWYIIERTTE